MNTNGFKSCLLITMAYAFILYIGNVYYADDLMRSYYGYMLWYNDGRPFADIFYSLIMQFKGGVLPDIYPFPFIISCVVFSFFLSKAITNFGSVNTFSFYIITICILGNPFILSNFLFRYDGAFMMLALACSVAPHSLMVKNKATHIIASSLFLILAFGLYQAAVNVFIGFAAIKFTTDILRTNNFRLSITNLTCSIISLAASYFIYSKALLPILPLNEYFSNFNKVVPLNLDGLRLVISNFKTTFRIINDAFNSGLMYPFFITSIVSLYFIIFESIKKGPYLAIVYIISFFGVAFSSFGIIIFGQHPAFYARVFMGFGCLLAFNIIIISVTCKRKETLILSSFVLAVPVMCIFFAGLNATKQEFDFQNNIAKMIVSDIYTSDAKNEVVISIDGSLINSPVAKNNISAFPVLKYVIPQIFTPGYDAGRLTLMRNGLHEVRFVSQEESVYFNSKASKSNAFAENSLYSLYHVDNVIVIRFK